MKETAVDRIQGESYCCVSTGESKFINKLRALSEEYPDDVEIKHVNEDGSVVAHVPYDWFRFVSPPIRRNITDEQRKAMSERMKRVREKLAEEK